MNTDKFTRFLENARLLSDKFGIIPLLYGSLGLEYLTGDNLDADDVDILVPRWVITELWQEFKSFLKAHGYILTDEHEHTFVRDDISYSYADIEDLEPFAKIREEDIAIREADGVPFRILSLRQYLAVYQKSSKDGYRVNVRRKKDNDKIKFIERKLLMKKIIVIGCPGSGKSTFSRALHQKTGLPLYHLDMMYWNPDKTTVEKSVFRERLSEVISRDEWIIDGNYASTMELRLAACETVIFLDYPLDVCLDGIRERRGKPRSDMPWVETEEDAEFIEFIKSYDEQQKPGVLSLLEKYRSKNVIILTSREEADEFLVQL